MDIDSCFILVTIKGEEFPRQVMLNKNEQRILKMTLEQGLFSENKKVVIGEPIETIKFDMANIDKDKPP